MQDNGPAVGRTRSAWRDTLRGGMTDSALTDCAGVRTVQERSQRQCMAL